MTGEWQPPHTSLLSTQQTPHREASNSHSASPPMPGWAESGLKTEQRVAGRRDSVPPSSARNGWAILVLGVMSSKRSVQILMLGTCECDLVWKWGHIADVKLQVQGRRDKMSSRRIQVGSPPTTGRGNAGHGGAAPRRRPRDLDGGTGVASRAAKHPRKAGWTVHLSGEWVWNGLR